GLGKPLLQASLLTVIIAAISVSTPLITRLAIDHSVANRDWVGLLQIMSLYAAMVALEWLVSYGQTLLAHRVAYGAITKLRVRVFNHLLSLDPGFHQDSKVGAMTSMVMNDTESLFGLIAQGFIYFISDLVTIVAVFATLMFLSPRLALVITFTMPLTLFGTQMIGKLVRLAQRQVRQDIADLSAGVEQTVSGVKDVKAFAREGQQSERIARLSGAARDSQIKSAKASALMFPMMDLTSAIGLGAVIWQGGILFGRGQISLGVLTAALLYVRRIHGPLMDLSQTYNSYQTAAAALDRVSSLLNRKPIITESEHPIKAGSVGDLQVTGVHFGYKESDVLSGVDLCIPAGSKIAIVGESGSGKSTMVKLLARLYDPRQGEVYFGGVDVRNIALKELRRRIQVVPQDTYLFPVTIWENIAYGMPDISREAVVRLSEEVGLREFFARLPSGMDTRVFEGGKSLSGGQRQAVAILRALIRDPDVLIFDEAASHLDPQLEKVIFDSLRGMWADKTIIVITHRTTSLGMAERIYEVRAGKLQEIDRSLVSLAGWREPE
ncbi:MAG TPA: ABC transporter ATP-binding protein, partial [Bacillota bacterium]|nr:ABC transporter ATP-binding protein [Bacillota bacterium]